MPNIDAVAPAPATGEDVGLIESLWDAFHENYKAFVGGEMPMKDEIKYQVLSSPGPRQYEAYSKFFNLLDDEENQIWTNYRKYMYMHDFADLRDGTREPAILELLQKAYDANDYYPKEITLVSGLFWGQHRETGNKIMGHFKKFHDRGEKVRILTRAKAENVGDVSVFSDDSHFEMPGRIPLHFFKFGDDYFFPEFPHTESTVFRLSMLLDLNTIKYRNGKSKEDMLDFLNLLIEKAI